MANILLIVDMLNDFAHEDGVLFFPRAAEIILEVRISPTCANTTYF